MRRERVIARHKEFIEKKLNKKVLIDKIEKVSKLPMGIRYVDWSMGYQAETDYSYRILRKNGSVTYCVITTFLSFFILRSRFFEEIDGSYRSFYP